MKEVDRTHRLQVTLNEDELRAIADYQFETRLQNRSEAVRELIRLGLSAHKARSEQTTRA